MESKEEIKSILKQVENILTDLASAQDLHQTLNPKISIFRNYDTNGLRIIPTSSIRWPKNFQAHHFLNQTPEIYDDIASFINNCQALPALYASIKNLDAGFFKNLFIRKKTLEQAQKDLQETQAFLEKNDFQKIRNTIKDAKLKNSTHIYISDPDIMEKILRDNHIEGQYCSILPLETLKKAFHIIEYFFHVEAELKSAARECLQDLRIEASYHLPLNQVKIPRVSKEKIYALEQIGIRSVQDAVSAPKEDLMSISGIGENTADNIQQFLRSFAYQKSQTAKPRMDKKTANTQHMVRILKQYDIFMGILQSEPLRSKRPFIHQIQNLIPIFDGNTSTWLVASQNKAALEEFVAHIKWLIANADLFDARPIQNLRDDDVLWQDYQNNAAYYQTLRSNLLDTEAENEDDVSLLDPILAESIRELTLNTQYLKNLSLRKYQSFGAAFSIMQAKTILGDEMGLGKTLQAIAFAAHLYAQGYRYIVVVCPPSLLENWSREIAKFSELPAFIAHGGQDIRRRKSERWRDRSGILLCTFDGVRTLDLKKADIVIVDEAHKIKNAETRRARAVSKVIHQCPYALLLTGTPMENHVDEFITLVGYLQPQLIEQYPYTDDPEKFRKQIAPAYLRRNQKDVLDELPDRIEHEETLELSESDLDMYKQMQDDHVHWMTLRQVSTQESSTISRIREIVNEAKENGDKVLIFSFFIGVLHRLNTALQPQVVGVITGQVSPKNRQAMVDKLADASPGSVLLSQINAGGEGLNIQCANVVIIAEPQLKPSIEEQAIARAHRMGQTRVVNVYRFIVAETADERIKDILLRKRISFDEYARPSDSASVPDATDRTTLDLQPGVTIYAENKQNGMIVEVDRDDGALDGRDAV